MRLALLPFQTTYWELSTRVYQIEIDGYAGYYIQTVINPRIMLNNCTFLSERIIYNSVSFIYLFFLMQIDTLKQLIQNCLQELGR